MTPEEWRYVTRRLCLALGLALLMQFTAVAVVGLWGLTLAVPFCFGVGWLLSQRRFNDEP